jgi:phenylalanyl-tRNA synthetase alpha chain
MEGAHTWFLGKGQPKQTRYGSMVRRREKIQRDLEKLPRHNLDVENVPAFDLQRNPAQLEHDEEEVRLMVRHLQASLETLVNRVFSAAKAGNVEKAIEHYEPMESMEPMKVRWVEAYFPFTSPSFELEVYWQGEWLELLGCGIVKQSILNNAGLRNRIGWAWGIGVERLAMLLFGIPDIRLFWSEDKRFLDQFKEGQIKTFEPFSKFPACYKDIAFWINASPAAASPIASKPASSAAAAAGGDATKASPCETQPAAFHENDVMEIVRDIGGSLVEDVKLVDEFVHPTSGRKSLCYRINYRSLERTLTNEEINKLHDRVAVKLKEDLRVELR